MNPAHHDPILLLTELDLMLAGIGFRQDSAVLKLVDQIREGVWAETLDRQQAARAD